MLALAPIPLGLLLDPLQLFNIAIGGETKYPAPLIVFQVFTMLCCITGGIGMCGGFQKDKLGARIGGVAIGLVLWLLDAGIVLFIGCCIGLSKIH